MTISLYEAFAQLETLTKNDRKPTALELRNLAANVSVDSSGSVTLLYGGTLEGGAGAGSVVKAMADSDPKFRVISNTQAAQLLNSDEFVAAIARAFDTTDLEVRSNRLNLGNQFLEATDGLWGDTSVRFIQETKGEVRIMSIDPDKTRILYARELPALATLLQDTTNVTGVDGIGRVDLLKAAAEAGGDKLNVMRNLMTHNAIHQTMLTLPTVSNFSAYRDITPAEFGRLTKNATAETMQKLYNYLTGFDVPKGVGRYLHRLGVVGSLIAAGVATTQAHAAEVAGDHEGAKKILKEFAVDAAGSRAGEALGVVLAGVALTFAAAVGVTVTAPLAGVVLLAAAFTGGFFGGDAAIDFYKLLDDRDDNGKRDIVDKLSNLFFGATSTIVTPLPADLNGEKFTVDASWTQSEMLANAKSTGAVGIAWRYALRELNSFVITDVSYAAHNTDGSLDLYNKDNDYLSDRDSGNYFNGGNGADDMYSGTGADFFIGGAGNDFILSQSGPDVIAFNVGDGQDTISAGYSLGSQDDTISLGGSGLDYADLSLQKSGNDLVLKVSDTDSLTFTNWYGDAANQNVLNLQLVAEAMAAFDAGSSDPLLNKKVQTFDFQGLVSAFDAARATTPELSSWALSNGLTQFHLAGSDSEALGGDLAYHYGSDGTLAGIGLGKAQDVLTNTQFGAQAQAVHSTASLQDGLIRLG